MRTPETLGLCCSDSSPSPPRGPAWESQAPSTPALLHPRRDPPLPAGARPLPPPSLPPPSSQPALPRAARPAPGTPAPHLLVPSPMFPARPESPGNWALSQGQRHSTQALAWEWGPATERQKEARTDAGEREFWSGPHARETGKSIPAEAERQKPRVRGGQRRRYDYRCS